ncbi:MAG: phosphatase [Desulfobacteraceae bacterium 4572_35.1]|nr:MAG: phosphatase [Desulfobacteraceae bacterium 4572_35.1]
MRGLVDLHMHSICSDGAYAPADLVDKAASAGVIALALCDHDNVDGVAQARSAGHQRGVHVIPGVELSCVSGEYRDVHLLGYGFDSDNYQLRQALISFKEFRAHRNRQIVDKINKVLLSRGKQELDFERVLARAGGALGRPHIAMELIACGYAKSVEDAFSRYLVPCNVSKRFFLISEAIELIKAAGGVSVLAHPPYITRDQSAMKQLLDELVAVGLQGVEVYNNGASCDDIEWYLTQARLRKLLVTGGSDFHGIEDGGAEFGKVRSIGAIPYSCFEDLYQTINS